MMSQTKFRTDYAIQARRQQEEKLATMHSGLRSNFSLKQKADWENKTENIIKKNVVKTKLQQLRVQNEVQLQQRRENLARLLEQEERTFQQEFVANLETPEQVREKMAERLRYLKDKREEERKVEVESKLDRRFRATTDELRKEELKLNNIQAQYERENQVYDKIRQQEQNRMEEQLYSELWLHDAKRKEEREWIERQERERIQEERNKLLEWQVNTRSGQKGNEEDQRKKEQDMLREQWKQEAEREGELERQRSLLNRDKNLDLLKHNEMERQLRIQQEQFEKERDKNMVKKVIGRENELLTLEMEEKRRQKEDAKNLIKDFSDKLVDQKNEEKMIDYLVKAEDDKQWDRKEQQWRKEDDAKITLLKDVYGNRADTLDYKKNKRMTKEEGSRKKKKH